MNRSSRNWNQIRDLRIAPGFCPASSGSVLIEMGNTRVICAASVDTNVPDHAASKGKGWLTAEYSLLPYSTARRTGRPLLKRDGRAVEIQRLLGRSLRMALDLGRIAGYAITVDCDVLQADGGTRCAAITGGYLALKQTVRGMMEQGLITDDPMTAEIAAVSAGVVQGQMLLDLDYSEDSRADVDLNLVMDGNLNLIEIQGTGENAVFSVKDLSSLVELATEGIQAILEIQRNY